MRISLNWLKKYVDTAAVSDEELIRLIGARLVEVEGVIDEAHKYDNIYIVRVEKVEKIPDTHLSLCMIDAGAAFSETGRSPSSLGPSPHTSAVASGLPRESSSSHLIQVVCGAPNVREGMLAVWIAPGAIVPASVHEDAPFVIGKRKMRGFESNGMLAGADELDFDDKHEKIAEIDPEIAKPGDLLAEVFDLNDKILEIENKSLTHRPDTFGIIGFAREVAGILGQKFISGRKSSEPIFSSAGLEFLSTSYAGTPGEPPLRGEPLGSSRNIRVKNSNQDMLTKKQVLDDRLSKKVSSDTPTIKINDSEICGRYTAVVLEKHGEMKKKYLTWEDTVLSKSGMRPIDPIVDATNYLMLLTGQPLHAFDYDKFVEVGGGERAEIGVRLAKAGEKIVLLDGAEVELTGNDIVICSHDKPVALAGAMGGKSTMIDEGTRKIILESATFSLYNLRKTQMSHGIFSEAITRFTKGQPPYQTRAVAEACAEMLKDGFRVVEIGDEYPKPEKESVVKITTDEINGLLGTNYDSDLIKKTLENVGFGTTFVEDLPEVTTEDEGASPVTTGASDPCPKQIVVQTPPWRTDIHIKEDIIEEVGRLLGYDNVEPTLPLHATAEKNLEWELKRRLRDLLAKYGANEVLTYSFVSERLLEKAQIDTKNSYKIINSISPELQYVRQSILPSLLDKTYLNEKLPVDKFAIFEINKVYSKTWGLNAEKVPVEKTKLGFLIAERKYNNKTAFYQAKKYVAKIFEEMNISVSFLPQFEQDEMSRPFEKKRAAGIYVDDECIGVVGEFKNSVRNEFKLAEYLAGFEIDLAILLQKMSNVKKIDFKKRDARDLTIISTKAYNDIVCEIKKVLADNNLTAEISPISIYQADNTDEKHISVHLEFDEINDNIMGKLEKIK